MKPNTYKIKRFPELKSTTLDDDVLFQMHKTLKQLLKTKTYFCHPYYNFEKVSVENMDKIVRQFIPKGSDLSGYDKSDIKAGEDFLNNRYIKYKN